MVLIDKILTLLTLISFFTLPAHSQDRINILYNQEYNHLNILYSVHCKEIIKYSKIHLFHVDNVNNENDIIWFNSHMNKFNNLCNDYIMWKSIDRALKGEELSIFKVVNKNLKIEE